jgi:hypothetical protein
VTKVSAPPSSGSRAQRHHLTYFDNGWTKTSADPWDIVTSYDYNTEGFEFVNETAEGYRKYRAADGSEVHIRPKGEGIRLGPKIDPGPNQKNYAPRYGPDGQRLAPDQDHSTGEMVNR